MDHAKNEWNWFNVVNDFYLQGKLDLDMATNIK